MGQQETLPLKDLVDDAIMKYASGRKSPSDLVKILRNNNCYRILSLAVDGDAYSLALTRASAENHIELLHLLLDNGMNVNIRNAIGHTALTMACYKSRNDSVRLLLDRNADVNKADHEGSTPLMLASLKGSYTIVQWLLDKNADVQRVDRGGWTCLMWSSLRNYPDIAVLLLNYNADFKVKTNRGKTALDFAKTEEMRALLKDFVNIGYVLK